MNRVQFNEYKNDVQITNYKRYVDARTIRIMSDYYFLQPSQIVDVGKERET